METYTKGPWYEATADEVIHIQSAVLNEDNYVCGIPLEELSAEANARLIAAAPELLEACKTALFHFENMGYVTKEENNGKESFIDTLTQAIAKAQGNKELLSMAKIVLSGFISNQPANEMRDRLFYLQKAVREVEEQERA